MDLTNRQMRDIYADLLIMYAEKYPDLIAIDADLRKAIRLNKFADAYPERAINVGVAEANMIGVAAGLANMGKRPFTHTFTPFASRRVFDQVTVSVAYAGLPVKMVGSDPGVMAQLNGGTHMSLEDVGLMRTLPTMTIVEPVDGVQLAALMPQIIEHDGPLYLRLIRQEFDPIFEEGETFEIGKAKTVCSGKDVTVFASGIMVKPSLDAAEMLAEEDISVEVINIHTVKPLDVDAIVASAKKTGAVVVAENHNIIGALGSAVAETLGERLPTPLKRVGIKDHFGEVGKKDFLVEKFGLTKKEVTEAIYDVLKKKK